MEISEKSKKEIQSLFFKKYTLVNNSTSFLICDALYSSSCTPKQLIQKLTSEYDKSGEAKTIKIHSLQNRILSLQKRKLIQSTNGVLKLTDTGRWTYVASLLVLPISSLFLLSHVCVTQKKLEKKGYEGFSPLAQFKEIVQYSHNMTEIVRNLRESRFIYRYRKRCVRIYPDKMQILEKYDYELDSLNKYLHGLQSDIEDIVNHDEVVKANFIRNCKLFAKFQENPKVIIQ